MTNRKYGFGSAFGQAVVSGFLLMVLLFASVAQAGVYLGGYVGSSSMEYDNVDNSSATKLTLGYQFTAAGGIEYSQIRTSGHDVQGTNASVSHDGYSLVGVYTIREPHSVFFASLKGGFYSIETTEKDGGLEVSDKGSNLAIGFGVGLGNEKGWRVLFDVDGYAGVKDFNNDSMVTLISLGLGYQF